MVDRNQVLRRYFNELSQSPAWNACVDLSKQSDYISAPQTSWYTHSRAIRWGERSEAFVLTEYAIALDDTPEKPEVEPTAFQLVHIKRENLSTPDVVSLDEYAIARNGVVTAVKLPQMITGGDSAVQRLLHKESSHSAYELGIAKPNLQDEIDVLVSLQKAQEQGVRPHVVPPKLGP